MRITQGPWRYEYGEVYGPNGDVVACRNVNHSPNTSPVQRDTDLAVVALVPELIDALTAMLKAYAPEADFTKPEELHSAVWSSGRVLAKLRKIQQD